MKPKRCTSLIARPEIGPDRCSPCGVDGLLCAECKLRSENEALREENERLRGWFLYGVECPQRGAGLLALTYGECQAALSGESAPPADFGRLALDEEKK